jgi:hypothetical protein
MLKDAGFVNVEVNRVAREPDEPHFETLLGVGVKTSGSSPEVAADGEESRTREAARKAAEAFARSP